ncbi:MULTISPECIES: mechanosensitive ion channel protein [unclassified Bacillus (in: firmicutes)]|uniref:mechanosensitive ion channel protein n=1 Tax=unclassified Bacillus (in: firmicutes) TaxID=185979 RepID=UPI0008E1FBE7|nr:MULTISPECIES: mechanosensitive ion channel protein [unclassified Bacillus (in: firmicutes)]SFJ65957.1 N-acetylglutamate synthase, GNAT family [Bacillus sp. 71mf]SFT14192.1 N-acetylglutamate synthase, GNAT family [Bacillus sp. 103mf]
MKQIRFATKTDVERLETFFGQAHIKEERLDRLYRNFMILEEEGQIQAAVGYERVGSDALLRSCLFTPTVDKATFLHFFETFLQYMKEKSIEQLYLLTNSPQSVTIFKFFQFETVEKDVVSKEIQTLEHFCKNVNQPNVIILNCQLFTKLSTD